MKTLAQLGRFGVVGIALNLALYLLYLVLTAVGLAPVVASTLSFLVGLPLSLSAHRRITFRVGEISTARKLAFVGLYLGAYVTLIGTLTVLHHWLGLPHPLAQAVAVGLAAVVMFTVQKRAIFQA